MINPGQIDKTAEVGWTAEEYAQCPELAERLHRRILDLEDAIDMAFAALTDRSMPDALARARAGVLLQETINSSRERRERWKAGGQQG